MRLACPLFSCACQGIEGERRQTQTTHTLFAPPPSMNRACHCLKRRAGVRVGGAHEQPALNRIACSQARGGAKTQVWKLPHSRFQIKDRCLLRLRTGRLGGSTKLMAAVNKDEGNFEDEGRVLDCQYGVVVCSPTVLSKGISVRLPRFGSGCVCVCVH